MYFINLNPGLCLYLCGKTGAVGLLINTVTTHRGTQYAPEYITIIFCTLVFAAEATRCFFIFCFFQNVVSEVHSPIKKKTRKDKRSRTKSNKSIATQRREQRWCSFRHLTLLWKWHRQPNQFMHITDSETLWNILKLHFFWFKVQNQRMVSP